MSSVDSGCPNSDTAAESLARRGIHPTHRVTALDDCVYSVIKWPGRLYYGLFAFDVMHHLNINSIGYCLDSILETMTPTMKMELDRRVQSFTSFRNSEGQATRRVTKLSSTAYLTAEMKVVHLFLWSHALGSKAMLLPSAVRADALIAISSLQTICYSVRGLRPYTDKEHRFIFNFIGKRFYRALSNIAHYQRQKQIETAETYNIGKPPEKRRRVPYCKPVAKLDDESSTACSSDEDIPPYFLRSDKIVPHCMVHFPEQVRMGGSHRFHNTSAAESAHPRCLGHAGARSRTYHNMNRSSLAMLNFLNDVRLLEEICRQSKIPIDEASETEDAPEENESSESSSNDDPCDPHLCVDPLGDLQPHERYAQVKVTCPVRSDEPAFNRLRRGRRGMHAVCADIHHDVWDGILCEGVPLSLREIVSLAAMQLKLQDTEHHRKQLLQCSWTLGWHVTSTTADKKVTSYWGGGVTPKTTSRFLRGDWVEIHGTEMCRGVTTSRLARIICGVKIRNIKRVFNQKFARLGIWENEACFKGDYVVYLLVRYANAHPDVGRLRGPEHRPLCPGELKHTHCLWQWYERPATFRRGCWRDRPWSRHKHLFGDTLAQQQLRKDGEARAWYDLIQVRNIKQHSNVQVDCDRPFSFLQSVMWC